MTAAPSITTVKGSCLVEYPWIIVRKTNETWFCEGTSTYNAGHRIPLSDGRTDGIYCGWSFDGQTLRVENDRYGIRPLFYCYHNNTLMLSPSVIQLLALGAPSEHNDAAMAVFARLGFFVGDDTAFQSIRAVPPDARFEFADGKLTVEGGPTIIARKDISHSEAVDGYNEYFRQSIKRRPPTSDRYAVPLSGGRDSRHILLKLHEQGHTPKEALTIRRYRPVPGDDFSFAQAIAQAVGVPHVPIIPKRSFTQYESEKNVLTHMCTDEMWWVIPIAEYANGRFDTLWDGLGGDVLSSSGSGASASLTNERNRMYEQGRLEELAEEVFGRWGVGEAAINAILPEQFRKRWTRDAALHRVVEDLRRYEGSSSPVTAFFFWNRARREIALSPTSMYRGVDTVYLPYLDHDLFDFLGSIPPEILSCHTIHNEAILKAHPRFEHIPFENRALQSFGLSLEPMQAIRSTLGLFGLAKRVAPQYLPIVRRWAWNKLRRRTTGAMPRRMMHYFIDMDGIRTQQGAHDMLARV
jgi:asparagine synthase (glutamine-hydrolysing)